MAFRVIDNPFTPGEPGSVDLIPLKDTGAQWRHLAIFNNGEKMVLADKESGIISAFVEEYEEADFTRRELIRAMLIKEVQKAHNAHVLETSPDLSDEDKSVLKADVPFGDNDSGTSPEWKHAQPLAIFVGDYEPHTHTALPTGNILPLDALVENRLIEAMEQTGVIHHFTS